MSTEIEHPPALYAARKAVFPKAVHGTFRRLKWWIMGLTLAIYYITPWIRWDRGPHVSDQAVLVDLENRRFFFFWIEIWPQEFYYIAGLLIMISAIFATRATRMQEAHPDMAAGRELLNVIDKKSN